MPEIDELVRLIKITMSSLPHRSEYTAGTEWCWRIAMPHWMSPEEQLALEQGLGLLPEDYVFCGNTDNNGKTQVMKIWVNRVQWDV